MAEQSGGVGRKSRAFADKLNKTYSAAQAREMAASTIAFSHERSNSFGSQTSINSRASQDTIQGMFSGTISQTKIVDPLDFEKYILENQPLADENDPVSKLLEFPDDDIEVTTIQRQHRTVHPSTPKDPGADTDPLVVDCVKLYTSNWHVVNRRYQFRSKEEGKPDSRRKIDRTGSFLEKLPKHIYEIDEEKARKEFDLPDSSETKKTSPADELPKGTLAASIVDLQTCSPDDLLPAVLDHIPIDEVDGGNSDYRQYERINTLMSVCPDEPDDATERRIPPPIPQEHFGQRILVKCLALKLELDIEPIFASMALYDGRVKKKISENFYFDMNTDEYKKMLGKYNHKIDISTLSRAAIFSVTYPSTDVFLVIKLEKVFQQGDIAEPYIRETDQSKNKEKLTSAAKENCKRLGKYRMPFAWTAIHLIDIINGASHTDLGTMTEKDASVSSSSQRKNSPPESPATPTYLKKEKTDSLPRRSNSLSNQRRSVYGDLDESPSDLSIFRPVTLTVKSFFKQESDKLKDDDLFKFLADLRRPSSLLKRLKCIPGVLKLDISPPGEKPPYCLTSELQQVHPYQDGQVRPVKEAEEFVPKEVYVPYSTYKNLLFVYPMNVNFSSRSGSVRNIAVKVQFLSGENPKTAPLECLFGKSSCASFSKAAWTSITYHDKAPDFNEEIKIKLPAHLTEQHHLLFTFYHISCSVKKGDDHSPTEVPIGYTWLPMLKDGQLVLGEFDLPVCMEQLPNSYSMLSPEINLPSLKWVDGHRGVFNVAVRAISSVHSRDVCIHRFLKNCHQVENRHLPVSPSRSNDCNLETGLKKSVSDLRQAQPEPLVRFLPIILEKLIMLLVRPPVVSGHVVNIGQSAFQSLAKIVERVHELLKDNVDNHGRSNLLLSFVTYVFNAPFSVSPANSFADLYKDERPISMHVTREELLQSKVHSSSNPSLNAPSDSLSPSRSLGKRYEREDWELEQISKVPGNRSSMAEAKAGHMRLPISPAHKKLVHEEIALQWAVATGEIRHMTLAHAWFFFELMVKSMAQYLDNIDKFYYPRSSRFPEQFMDDVRALVGMATSEIIEQFSQDASLAKDLNSYLSFFFYDILSLMDRGYVLKLFMHYYTEIMSATVQKPGLAELRLNSLRIVCSHEHYVTLNLPFKMPLFPSPQISPSPSMASIESSASSMMTSSMPPSMAELSVSFRRQHYLSGLLLSELSLALDGSDTAIQDQAIDCITDLIQCHDSDTRYDEPSCRARVASLYLPLLGVVTENFSLLHGAPIDDDHGGLNISVANAIATSSLTSRWVPNNDDIGRDYSAQKSQAPSLTPDSTRRLLLCFLWVIKNEDSNVLKEWWARQPSSTICRLLDVLDLCTTIFKYNEIQTSETKATAVPSKPDSSSAKAKLEEAILAKGAAREMMARHRESRFLVDKVSGISATGEAKLRWQKDKTQYKQAKQQERHDPDIELKTKFFGCMSGEIAMIILDTLENIVETSISSDHSHTILSGVLKVLLHCLNCYQSERVLQSMFPTQRSIVAKYPELLFEDDTELIADLCSRLLHHCSSSQASIRTQASASLYLLMRQNYQIGNNFSRVKMQVTLSLSSLVGTPQYVNGDHLKRSLKTVITYAETDHELKNTNFPEQVRELVFNLHMILTNTVKMHEFNEDPEMLIDLMYRIAKGYQNSPDLRLTWLQNMAAQHTKLSNHLEAAMCVIHAAALVAEYLYLVEDQPHLPIGCVSFEKISPNVLEESAISDDIVAPDQEGICTGKYFSENGLLGLLEQAAAGFSLAHTYECVNEVYKISLPIYEVARNFKKLYELHGKLSSAFDNIIKNEGKRMMGTYFRVGFFGEKFGDLDGEEFIYKEPAITKLPEISLRLQSFYKDRFGEDAVEVIKDSNAVDTSKLDPEKAYIQLTYVEPYFAEYEMKDRRTYFDKNYNIRRFVFATPFTPSGQAHADSLVNQYKRKTILTVSHAFPYLKTRVNVIDKEEITLTPIQVAIEDIQKKIKELKAAVLQEPPDKKILQMVLQGCVGTAVNQGPLAMALAFLSDFNEDNNKKSDEKSLNISRDHHKLRLCFKAFVKCCGEALKKNKELITEEQKEYQKELRKNYKALQEQLNPLLKNRFGTLRGSVGMRKKESLALRKLSMGLSVPGISKA
ncbi:dedicator of cytokinesis protein 7-like [Dendronephthya gigantea]|uniref:dedicator of cytokinesis protein 7-like n=1 Tax=Dendronephthya gigantea TaxID=151771 RepID=UPI00106BE7BB|nr:dedicator of cytokinesis protein 7-like [Dendronephthya gigantea]